MGRKRSANYIDPEEFRQDLVNSLNRKNALGEHDPQLTKEALDKMQKMIDRLLNQKMKYANPQDREDCKSRAWEDILRYWKNYKPDSPSTPFSYFTSMILIGATKFWKEMYKDKKELNTISMSAGSDTNEIFSI